MSEVKVNKISPRSGTTITLGDSGDTFTVPSGVTFDASSGGLAGTLTTAAQPNITSVGTLTSFTSTGIDDNATSTAITIDSNENVGIGTSSPSNPLHLSSTSYPQFAIQNSTSTYRMGVDSNQKLIFDPISGSTRNIVFQNSGAGEINVGIGTSSPETKLHVYSASSGASAHSNGDDLFIENSSACGITIGSGATSVGTINFADSSAQYDGYIEYNHANRNMRFATAISEAMRIDSSGNVGIGTTSPTQKLDVNGTVKATAFQGDGSALTNLPGGGKVLQVVSTEKTDTFSSSSTNWTDVTGLTASITPSASNSKVLVLVNFDSGATSGYKYAFKLVRASTDISIGDSDGSRARVSTFTRSDGSTFGESHCIIHLDSPSTTSSTTYKIQGFTEGSSFYVNRQGNDTNNSTHPRSASNITLMEIGV